MWQVTWSPTARLLVGTTGAALLGTGASRRGMGGLALGALGTALIARAVTNIPCRDWLGAGGDQYEADLGRQPGAGDAPLSGVGRTSEGTVPMRADRQ